MKQQLKKISIHLSASVLILFAFSNVVFGEGAGVPGGGIQNPIKANSLADLFNNIVSVCIEIGTILSVLGIMYGGFLYVTAQGNEEKLGQAQKTITWALVGTAVLLGARTIMAAVRGTIDQLGTS